MNWLDIIIIIIGIIFGVLGLWKGAIKAAFGIAGLIGGVALAGHYYGRLATILSSEGAAWAGIAAYVIILVATLVVASIIGWFIAKLVHITMLGWVDRLVGCILGVVIGGMLCAAALAIATKYFPSVEAITASSPVAKFIMAQSPLLLALLPNEFDFIRNFFLPSP
jgi:Uncharacterized membrane protein, required for colicin V production